MCMENDGGKPKNSEKNLSQCHSVHHKSYMDWLGREPGSPRWEAGDWTMSRSSYRLHSRVCNLPTSVATFANLLNAHSVCSTPYTVSDRTVGLFLSSVPAPVFTSSCASASHKLALALYALYPTVMSLQCYSCCPARGYVCWQWWSR
jgi:hypothetical protein